VPCELDNNRFAVNDNDDGVVCSDTEFAGKSHMRAYRQTVIGTRHAVAACHYRAAETGLAILEAGGNAIDAGVAMGLALAVVQPEYVNVAGVAPIILYSAGLNCVFTITGLSIGCAGSAQLCDPRGRASAAGSI
jgi:gamma-glutamyltranspeptidase